MKVTRIIQYEGKSEDILEQLAKSLPDGIKQTLTLDISVLILGNISLLEAYKQQEEKDK